MCVEAQPEKAAPKKFKEVRRTSTVLRSECSSENQDAHEHPSQDGIARAAALEGNVIAR
jgi:hypothetical protein